MAEPPVRYPPGSPDDLAEQEAARQWADREAIRAGASWHGPTWGSKWPINVATLRRDPDEDSDDEAVS